MSEHLRLRHVKVRGEMAKYVKKTCPQVFTVGTGDFFL